MNVDKALRDLEKEAESLLYQWLKSMVGEKGEAQVCEFFVMRITKEKLKEKIDERVKTELKEANQRIQALEQELKEYKANAKDIQEACELLRLKI